MKRFLAVCVALITLLLAGCGSFDTMRSEFVALRYMQEAEANLTSYPRDTTQAIRELNRAVALMPDDEQLRRRAARFYTSARAYEEAIPLFEAQQDLDRQDQLAYARCLLNTGREDEGAQICLQIISRVMKQREQSAPMQPEWALLLNDSGYILADADMHIDRAEEAVRVAVDFMPLEGAFIDSLGWALYRKGELEDAAFYLERSRRHASREDPEILYHLGVVYARLGRYRDATEALRKARELEPGWDAVRKELRRLGRILPPPVLAACRPAGTATGIDHSDQI
ncbi:MAG: tetratricopeptide repeat protein [Armatimonadia bacterium]|nr:tetratricopeptide repeat protein [Armatimonadia bacterium]